MSAPSKPYGFNSFFCAGAMFTPSTGSHEKSAPEGALVDWVVLINSGSVSFAICSSVIPLPIRTRPAPTRCRQRSMSSDCRCGSLWLPSDKRPCFLQAVPIRATRWQGHQSAPRVRERQKESMWTVQYATVGTYKGCLHSAHGLLSHRSFPQTSLDTNVGQSER